MSIAARSAFRAPSESITACRDGSRGAYLLPRFEEGAVLNPSTPDEATYSVPGAPERCYTFECDPIVLKDGRFKARATIRPTSPSKGLVFTINPDVAPFAHEADAIDFGHAIALKWVELHG
jgi:hypothetical protein